MAMAETSAERASAIQTTAASVQGLDSQAQVAALSAVIQPPNKRVAGVLWILLVGGLVLLLTAALGGLIVMLLEGKSTDVLLTVFTTGLAGLIGLFAPSPIRAEPSGVAAVPPGGGSNGAPAGDGGI
jgi:hypothetical protein